ncbi:hypothetical protein SeMB42_g06126 [Synchytrium endobioticum]|uniref:Uncharacterized protein n=1 Tax=Synchytrium endobioticum TaxID=286115 RepID=A0A507CK90_9FUNG|nr:hypothetical protein SeMB42_g06126 [Synchytrium endobioticum]
MYEDTVMTTLQNFSKKMVRLKRDSSSDSSSDDEQSPFIGDEECIWYEEFSFGCHSGAMTMKMGRPVRAIPMVLFSPKRFIQLGTTIQLTSYST